MRVMRSTCTGSLCRQKPSTRRRKCICVVRPCGCFFFQLLLNKIVERAIEPINIQSNIKWVIETPICFFIMFFFYCKKLHIALRWVNGDLVIWCFGHTATCAQSNQRHQENEWEWVCCWVSHGCEDVRGSIWHLISVVAHKKLEPCVSNTHTRNQRVSRSADAIRRVIVVGAWLFSLKHLSTRVG